MATKSPKTPTELEAQTVRIHSLKTELEGVQATIKSEAKAAEIARDGFDKYDIKNAALVPALARNGIPADRQQAFETFQRGRLAELMSAEKDLKLALAEAREQWQALHNKWRSSNAEGLRTEAAQRVEDLAKKIFTRLADHQALRQKITQIAQITTQRAALQSEHDAACGTALAAGAPMPESPQLPELPAETGTQIEGAIRLIALQIDELRQDQQRASDEARALQNLIDRHKVDAFTDMIVGAAKEQGLRLGDVRDKLVEIAGPTVSAQMDAGDAHRFRAELAVLRPEVEALRANVATLQNGIHKLTTSRSY